MPAIIKNPFSITDKACTMYRMPYNSLQSQLPSDDNDATTVAQGQEEPDSMRSLLMT